MVAPKKAKAGGELIIRAPKFGTAAVAIKGTAPLMIEKFSAKARLMIQNKHEAGSTSRSKKNREARDFQEDMEGACYKSADGWYGVNAATFRCGMISACRLVDFKMTLAKLSLFVEADGLDAEDGTPLVRLDVGEPELSIMPVRNATGVVDLRARPLWREWGATLRLRWDADQFTASDVVNLLLRVGQQGGIGAGRPDSRQSAGLGYGLFTVESSADEGEIEEPQVPRKLRAV